MKSMLKRFSALGRRHIAPSWKLRLTDRHGLAAFAATLIAVDGACSGGANGSSGPTQIAASPLPDPVQADNAVLYYGCTTPSPSATQYDTPNAQWQFSWSDGTTSLGRETWPKGNGSTPATLTVWDDPRNAQTTFAATQQAAQFWQSQLNSGNPGTMLLSLAIDTNALDESSAPVTVYDTQDMQDWPDGAQDPRPDEGGSNVLIYSETSMTILDAYVILGANLTSQQTYTAALHEMGHALGLNHSPYQWSVMFPYISSCITPHSTTMAAQDKHYLWNVYDPGWHPVNTCASGGTCYGGGKTIFSRQPRRRFSGNMAYIVPRGRRALPTIADLGLRASRMFRVSHIPTHPRAFWHMVEDNDHSDDVTMDSMWLSSSLVASVRIEGDLKSRAGDLFTTTYKVAKISGIYKHLYSPDASLRPGDTIIVADRTLPHGDEIADDLTLSPKDGEVMVFLQRSGITTTYGGERVPVYVETSLFNSKFAIGASGALQPLSVRQTIVNRHMDRRTLFSALLAVRNGPSVPTNLRSEQASSYNEADAVSRLLSRNGYDSPSLVARYQRMMFANPHAIYERHAVLDALHRGRRS